MYVKSITIDGFKSYSKRTVIRGFDSEFNAITGLNGSGKSNILDSICFVLGIRNLSSVRATQLQDLVYKSGQAGIKEAMVSIEFDNRDKAHSPHGYNHCDEIVVSRKIIIGAPNKYFINSVKVTEKKVADMFATVQLNVNNPHFLIMQGRINKVINMKPKEILGLIEEAAGTKFFETKKEQSIKTIAKKDERIAEIDELLEKRIGPEVRKLRSEKEKYQEYQRLKIKVNSGHRMLVAIRYRDITENMGKAEGDVSEKEREREVVSTRLTAAKESQTATRLELDQLNEQHHNESGSKEMEQRVSGLKDLMLKANQALKTLADELQDLGKREKDALKEIATDKETTRKKQDELAKKEADYGDAENLGEADLKLVEEAEREVEELKQGRFQDASGKAKTIHQQLQDARKEATAAATALTTHQRTYSRLSFHSLVKKGNRNDPKRTSVLTSSFARVTMSDVEE